MVSQGESQITILDLIVLLVQRKRFITRFVLGAAILSIVGALLLPVQYEAKVTLMPPAQHSSLTSALLGQMGSMGSLAALATGGSLGLKNPADVYVSLLTSRTVEDAMIQNFGLMAQYRDSRISDARKDFEHRTSVVPSSKDGL